MTKTFLTVLPAIIMLCWLFPSCTQDEPEAQMAVPLELPAGYKACVKANNEFAVKTLLAKAAVSPFENNAAFTYSAFSIFATLANGADEENRRIILQELGCASLDDLNAFIQATNSQLPYLDPGSVLQLYNGLWIRSSLSLSQPFKTTAHSTVNPRIDILEKYGNYNSLPYDSLIQGHISSINKDIEASKPDVVWCATPHLGAKLQHPFNPSKTVTAPFLCGDGSECNVKIMHQQSEIAYGEFGGWQSVSLPLGNGAFTFVALLPPKTGELHSITTEIITGCLSVIAVRPVSLNFPYIMSDWMTHWKGNQLSIDHITPIASPDVQYDRLVINNRSLQKRILNGVDIASAFNLRFEEAGMWEYTGNSKLTKPEGIPAITLSFDRPFIYMVREQSSGLILFIGQMTKGV